MQMLKQWVIFGYTKQCTGSLRLVFDGTNWASRNAGMRRMRTNTRRIASYCCLPCIAWLGNCAYVIESHIPTEPRKLVQVGLGHLVFIRDSDAHKASSHRVAGMRRTRPALRGFHERTPVLTQFVLSTKTETNRAQTIVLRNPWYEIPTATWLLNTQPFRHACSCMETRECVERARTRN